MLRRPFVASGAQPLLTLDENARPAIPCQSLCYRVHTGEDAVRVGCRVSIVHPQTGN